MVALVLSVLLSSAAADQPMPNPLILRISGADTGDRGCYLSGVETLADGTEIVRDLMADFGCEHSFTVGHTYEIRWRQVPVQADTCEGNPDCTDSDMEPFADSAKPALPRPNVVFDKGRTSKTIQGFVEPAEQVKHHFFAGREGQSAAIAIVSTDMNATFSLARKVDGKWVPVGDGTTWSGVLPDAEGSVYKIEVAPAGGVGNYELFVGIGK